MSLIVNLFRVTFNGYMSNKLLDLFKIICRVLRVVVVMRGGGHQL